MTDKQISDLTAMDPIVAAVLAHIVQGGNSRKYEGTLGRWLLAGAGNTNPGIWDHSQDGNSAAASFTGLAGATDILLIARLVTKSTSTVLGARLSANNGSSYFSSAGDYVNFTATGAEATADHFGMHGTNATSARSGMMLISGCDIDGALKAMAPLNRGVAGVLSATTSPINAAQVVGGSGGNLTGGIIYCLARF